MADQEAYSRTEQPSVIKSLVAEGCKPVEICRRISAVYGATCFSIGISPSELSYLKKDLAVLRMKAGLGAPQKWGPLGWRDQPMTSLRRAIMDEIARTLSLFVRTAHKIVHDDLGYWKFSWRWVPMMLAVEHKWRRAELSQQCLFRFETDGYELLKKVVTCDESWI